MEGCGQCDPRDEQHRVPQRLGKTVLIAPDHDLRPATEERDDLCHALRRGGHPVDGSVDVQPHNRSLGPQEDPAVEEAVVARSTARGDGVLHQMAKADEVVELVLRVRTAKRTGRLASDVEHAPRRQNLVGVEPDDLIFDEQGALENPGDLRQSVVLVLRKQRVKQDGADAGELQPHLLGVRRFAS